MRALAVIVVVLFHSSLDIAPAGFLGVEIFFVISGFIITHGLLSEKESRSGISLPKFWARRAKRLLPALFLLLIAAMAYAEVFEPREVAGMRGDVIAALTYVTNWYLTFNGQSYFESFARPQILQHLWSLAIEEQFYLIWPLVISGGLALMRPRLLAPLVIAGAVASATAMVLMYDPAKDVSRIYYGTDTRASGLLAGAALAFFLRRPGLSESRGRIGPLSLDLVGIASLAILTWAVLSLSETDRLLFRGGFALVGVASVALIVASVHPRTLTGKVLGCAPMRWIGLRSYGIYLWHWPIFAFVRPGIEVPWEGPVVVAAQVAVAVFIAGLSYRFLEQPVRKGALGRTMARVRGWRISSAREKGLATVSAALAVVCIVGVTYGAVAAESPKAPDYFALDSVRIVSTSNGNGVRLSVRDANINKAFAAGPRVFVAKLGRDGLVPAEEILEVVWPEAANTALDESETVDGPAVVRITAVGDSVMLGAARTLANHFEGIDVDAAVSRAMINAISILRERERTGELGEVLLIHIGNNGPIKAEHVDEVVSIAGADRKILFVNLKVPRWWEDPNNEVIEDGVERHPNAILVDWHAEAQAFPDIFWDDGIHLRPDGALFYVDLIEAGLRTR